MLDRTFFNKLAFTTSIKAAIGLTLVAAIALYFHYTLFWWAIFTTFLCFSIDVGSSIMTMLARLYGTFLGALAGVLITLIYQLPWLYFPVLFFTIFCGFYYTVKSNVSWVSFLAVVTLTVVAVAGPLYVNGAFHYAAERFTQICLSISVVALVLFFLKGASAHGILRERLVRLLKKYELLWGDIIQDFNTGQRNSEIQPLVRSISLELVQLHAILAFTRFEVWKKNFNSGQCNALLHLMKQFLSLMTGLNEVTRYVTAEDFSDSVRDLVGKLDTTVKKAIANLSHLVENTSTEYDGAIDLAEKELHKFMDGRLEYHIQERSQGKKIPLHRTAWFSLVVRLFRVTRFMRRVTVLMNKNKVDPELKKQLNRELRWLTDENRREMRLNTVRLKVAFHSSVTAMIIIFLQQYFQWLTIFSVFSVLVTLFISLSLIIPFMGNLGVGILGGCCGLVYTYFASIILNYYPFYSMVLMLLFVAAMLASYLLLITKMQGRAFHAFSVFFMIVVVYSLTQTPNYRGNFDFALCVILAIILPVFVYSIISRLIFPINYVKLLRDRLRYCLAHAGRLLWHLNKIEATSEEVKKIMNLIYHQNQYINRARNSIRYCSDQFLYQDDQVKELYEMTYSCELLQLASLNMLRSFIVLSKTKVLGEFQSEIQGEFKLIIRSLFKLSRAIQQDKEYVIDEKTVKKIKDVCDTLFHRWLDKILVGEDRVRHLRAMAILYNAFYRMADVQTRLNTASAFQTHR